MIQLPALKLPKVTSNQLRKLQAQVNLCGPHQAKVAAAKKLFASKNRKNDTTFKVVRQVLSEMCFGAQRCCYCEDSAADEVEHIKPKNLYPGEAFVWENYLYACGTCNGPKNDKFAVFDPVTGVLTSITRLSAGLASNPPVGTAVLIDPRREDPLHFFELDMKDTFQFVPAFGLSPQERDRAVYTENVLRLNERDLLVQARKTAYGSYIARFKEYVVDKNNGVNSLRLTLYVTGLKRMDHPTVWREIQRQHVRYPHLAGLFSQAPEALTW
jgi:uncharacterized protein (TIGR02646 family)